RMDSEEGQTWAEADGEPAEEMDVQDFYARDAFRWGGDHQLTPYPTEDNELRYIPLGIGAVIPPWNFPLAILSGMTTAAWVTGNTVILKPSSDSPAIGYRYMELLEEAGLPHGVVNFLPGPGSTVGDKMVKDARTRFISFTGSMDVGLGINEAAAKTVQGQIWIKRVVAEMGGKDAILVDETADIEAAAAGIVSAAFGFQGQKCSACSRLIAHESIHDELLERVVAGARAIQVGHPEEQSTQMGAVINERAFNEILGYIRVGREEGEVLAGGQPMPGSGWTIMPTVISGLAPNDRIMQEEIFGPVLGVTKVRSFEEGLDVANGTIYGLTGAFYTKDPARVAMGKDRFHVGNLYVNRKCTGALVGAHPFGGFNMSGTDSKAGSRDYLGLFLQAKLISTLRT
ncbi:aldehyde dehydrogenase family protein, partial [bacterium]|nr:aldehyde dehydrogenase family protein [bacterium]